MTLYFENQQIHDGETGDASFGSDVNETYAVLSGFNPSYANEQEVRRFRAFIDDVSRPEPNSITYSAVSELNTSDKNGKGDLWVTLIGKSSDDLTQFKEEVWQPGDGELNVTMSDQPAPLASAYVFAQQVKLQYSTKHYIRTIKIDTGNDNLVISQNKEGENGYSWGVRFTPRLVMKDDSGNSESSSDSFIALLVVFVPQD